ncbi:MAG: autotransporter outer membrane beta-barrel domain-containing protein, partial [Rhodanobacteraceae bacterium]
DSNAAGYDITTAGFTLGADYRLTSRFAVGLSAGYAHSNADLINGGHVNVKGGKIGVYATYFSAGFYFDGALTGGLDSCDTHRAALLGTARGSTNGAEFNALLGAGYDWNCAGCRFGPTAILQYTGSNFGELRREWFAHSVALSGSERRFTAKCSRP